MGEDRRSLSSLAQSSFVDVSTSANEEAGQQGPSQTSAVPANEDVAEEGPVLSRINPRRGPTSGGDEINLIVTNLPPSITLWARFGSNIAPTVSGMTLSGLAE